MFWKILDRTVNLSFLVLSVIIISILVKTGNEDYDSNTLHKSLQASEVRLRRTVDANLSYIEGKVNSVAKTQDEYQSSTSRRMEVLENKIKVLEKENKDLKVFKRDSTVLIQNNNVQQNNNK